MVKKNTNTKDKNNTSSKQNINWFPGHMAKSLRKMAEQLKIIDLVVEICDARIPISSRNPDLSKMLENKPRIILLNKCDMADDNETVKWIEHFKNSGVLAIPVECKSGKGLSQLKSAIKTAMKDKLQKYAEQGMVGKPIRVMVVGVPNVGKSSFINRISGGAKAKAENRPGVTRGNQWFTIDKQLELLDTPGVLWPKFEDSAIGEHLSFTGAVTDRIVDTELLAVDLIKILIATYPELLKARYSLDELSSDEYETLCLIGKKRGMVIRGGETDTLRAANMVLEEYRNCKIGKITLERVEDYA